MGNGPQPAEFGLTWEDLWADRGRAPEDAAGLAYLARPVGWYAAGFVWCGLWAVFGLLLGLWVAWVPFSWFFGPDVAFWDGGVPVGWWISAFLVSGLGLYGSAVLAGRFMRGVRRLTLSREISAFRSARADWEGR